MYINSKFMKGKGEQKDRMIRICDTVPLLHFFLLLLFTIIISAIFYYVIMRFI
jgi:hypothetical protein